MTGLKRKSAFSGDGRVLSTGEVKVSGNNKRQKIDDDEHDYQPEIDNDSDDDQRRSPAAHVRPSASGNIEYEVVDAEGNSRTLSGPLPAKAEKITTGEDGKTDSKSPIDKPGFRIICVTVSEPAKPARQSRLTAPADSKLMVMHEMFPCTRGQYTQPSAKVFTELKPNELARLNRQARARPCECKVCSMPQAETEEPHEDVPGKLRTGTQHGIHKYGEGHVLGGGNTMVDK